MPRKSWCLVRSVRVFKLVASDVGHDSSGALGTWLGLKLLRHFSIINLIVYLRWCSVIGAALIWQAWQTM